MPSLDRVIAVGIQGPNTNEGGTPIPGPIVDSERWARLTSYRFWVDRDNQVELYTEVRYRVRYEEELAWAFLRNRLSVLIREPNGDMAEDRRFQVESVQEVGRREWLDLRILYTAG